MVAHVLKTNTHIEIVSSSNARLSSMSRKSRQGVQAILARHYARVGITIVDDLSDLEDLAARQPDLVFLGMEFIPDNQSQDGQNDRIWISQYLDSHDIAYTGSSHLAHKLARNKAIAKQSVLQAGLKTAPFYVAGQSRKRTGNSTPLSFPLFVKPTDRGGGQGVDSNSVVYTLNQLDAKISSITKDWQSDSLVEEYLSGREFSVGLLRDESSDEIMAMPLELIAPEDTRGQRLLSAGVKFADAESFTGVSDEILKSKLIQLAINVFSVLGARDFARVDIRLDSAGTPHFLEANLIPSLIENYGSFPKACVLNMDMDQEAMLLRIVRLGLTRSLSAGQGLPVPQSAPVPVP